MRGSRQTWREGGQRSAEPIGTAHPSRPCCATGAKDKSAAGMGDREYAIARGEKPILNVLDSPSVEDQIQAVALIELLQERGDTLRAPESKALGRGLFELRGRQVRRVRQDLIVLREARRLSQAQVA